MNKLQRDDSAIYIDFRYNTIPEFRVANPERFMKIVSGPIAWSIFLYIVIVLAAVMPIWSIRNFAVQDGAAHVYNAFLLSEYLKGDPAIGSWLTLNTLTVPNSGGHWLLVILLQFFTGFTSMKLMTTACYAAFVAAVSGLRYQVAGEHDLPSGVLLAGVLGFNWFWFGGFYNFNVGIILFVLLNAICFRWRDNVSLKRAAVVSLILLATYLSHFASFGLAAGSVFLFALFSRSNDRRRNLKYFFLSVAPSITFAIAFRLLTSSDAEGLHPTWRWLSQSTSISGALTGLLIDPFIIISRRSLPFIDLNSNLFAIFSPGLWTTVSLILLGSSLVRRLWRREQADNSKLPFLVFLLLSIIGALISPDDLGISNGGIFRERMLLSGFCLFVPLFDVQYSLIVKRAAQALLLYVIAFQSVALWDYGRRTELAVTPVEAAQSQIADTDTVATIVMIKDGYRFHSIPEPQLGLLTSIGKKTILLDNYEMGHYVFPLIPRDPSDRRFIRKMAEAHAFVLNGPQNEFDTTLAKLNDCLVTDHQRFTKIILIGSEPRVEAELYKWFDPQPIYDSDGVRILRHKN